MIWLGKLIIISIFKGKNPNKQRIGYICQLLGVISQNDLFQNNCIKQ